MEKVPMLRRGAHADITGMRHAEMKPWYGRVIEQRIDAGPTSNKTNPR